MRAICFDFPLGGPVERVEGLERGRRLRRGRDHLFGQIDRATAARAEDIGGCTGHAAAGAVVVDDLELLGGVEPNWLMATTVGLPKWAALSRWAARFSRPAFDGARVRVLQGIELDAAVHLEGPDRRHQDDRGRVETAGAAFQVEELLAAQVEGEARPR